MKIRDVMTPDPVACSPDDSLQTVCRQMDALDTGIMPLVKDGRLVGVITDRDVAVRAVADGADPCTTKAITYATRDVTMVGPHTDVMDAVELMEAQMIRRLVVVDGQRLVGIVSLGDLAECDLDDAEDVLVEVSKSEKTLAHKRPSNG